MGNKCFFPVVVKRPKKKYCFGTCLKIGPVSRQWLFFLLAHLSTTCREKVISTYKCRYVIFRIKMFYIRSLFILSSVLKSWFSYIWEVCFESLCMTMTSSIFREHLTSVNIYGGILRTKSMISILWFYTFVRKLCKSMA